MPKTYFNNSVVGNSGMLACIASNGELVRLFWPHIDFPQHIDKVAEGVYIKGSRVNHGGTLWLDSADWSRFQEYEKDTNILITGYSGPLKIRRTDFVLTDRDILVRKYEFENPADSFSPENNRSIELAFVSFTSFISTIHDLSSVMFDFDTDSLVHYRHGYYFAIASNREVTAFQLGNNSYESARTLDLKSNDQIGMMYDGAMSWDLGRLEPGETKSIVLYFCPGRTLKEAKDNARSVKNLPYSEIYRQTRDYWSNVLKNARIIHTKNREANELYKRSVLLFKLMSDKRSGGLLASPEVDEEFTRCGRYAYCWGRDAAFITTALDLCGLTDDVTRFYKWAAEFQEEDGSWLQRYHMDGNLAPCWGLQVDETGTLIWGMLQHYKMTGDRAFLAEMWESMKKGAQFLEGFIDSETGLPFLSFDLWEERLGEHAYSSAAVYAGLKACAETAGILGDKSAPADRWNDLAERLFKAIERNFWKEGLNRFIRSIRVKTNPWGMEEPGAGVVWIKVNSKGYSRDFSAEDYRIDSSLLGLSVPFEVYKPGSEKMNATLDAIEKNLTARPAGGLYRYEGDNYIGGNPWIITTLWAALYHIRTGNYNKALEYFNWTIKSKTGLGFLPEQVDKNKGEAAWVIPLTWSHAMFVLVMYELYEAGVI